MRDTRYVGKPASRVDALEKVLGTAKYVADLRLPGMLVARCLRSTLPHARIVKLDVSPALKVPGVRAAITCEDFVNHGRFGFPVQDMFMLAFERVRYAGDAIAAVAAEDEASLQAGLDAIILELEPLAAVFDPAAALDPAAPIVGENPWDAPDLPRGNLLNQYIVRQGQPDEVLAACDTTLEGEYSTMHQEHAYIETEGALAVPGPDRHSVTVYANCQSPFMTRGNLVQTLDLKPEHVRVIQPPVGGAFGGKDDLMYQTIGQVAQPGHADRASGAHDLFTRRIDDRLVQTRRHAHAYRPGGQPRRHACAPARSMPWSTAAPMPPSPPSPPGAPASTPWGPIVTKPATWIPTWFIPIMAIPALSAALATPR